MKLRILTAGSLLIAMVWTTRPASALTIDLCLAINDTCHGDHNPSCTNDSDCLLSPILSKCDEVHGRCVAPCVSDFVEVNLPPLACSDPDRPACQLSGLLTGKCTECSETNLSVCLLYPDRPACVTASGFCGCNDDSDCPSGACDPTTHRCISPGSSSGGSSSGGGESSSGGASSSGGTGPNGNSGSSDSTRPSGKGLIVGGGTGLEGTSDGEAGAGVVEGGGCSLSPARHATAALAPLVATLGALLIARRRRARG